MTTFLHQQRTGLRPAGKPPPQKSSCRRRGPADHPRRKIAAMPPAAAITTSTPAPIAAKLFGFPTVIAHRDVHCRGGIGEYRSPFSGRGALFGSVRQAGAAAGHPRGSTSPKGGGWDLTLRNRQARGYPRLTATVRGPVYRRYRVPRVKAGESVKPVDVSSGEFVDTMMAQSQCQPGIRQAPARQFWRGRQHPHLVR